MPGYRNPVYGTPLYSARGYGAPGYGALARQLNGPPAKLPYTDAMTVIWMRVAAAYVAAGVVAAVLGCIASTQFTLAGLVGFGMEVPVADWLYATLHDVIGMGPLYMTIAAVAFLPAFGIATGLLRWVPGARGFWFAVAGAASIVTAILIIKFTAGGTVIGGARTPPGLLAQALAGGAAGWLFARILAWKPLT